MPPGGTSSEPETLRCLSALDRLDLMDLNEFLDDLQMWELDCLLHGLQPVEPNSRTSLDRQGAVTNQGGD